MIDAIYAQLERTPPALDALLRGLPDATTRADEGPGTWSAFDIVGHLIHGERTDWRPRVERILASGDTLPFAPFDRLAQERESLGKSLPELLDEFRRCRLASLSWLRGLNLQPADLERRGRHPALGTVTLGNLLATWAAHDLTHLHQIARVLAFPYRDAVGPWQAYLGVLHCNGHGS